MKLSSVSKALAGALVTMLVAYLMKHGITLEPTVTSSLTVVVEAAVSALGGFLAVYFAPKNQ